MVKFQENEMRFRILTESSPVGIYETDANGLCVYVNPKWCEMSGLTLPEALGTGWLMGIYVEDRERIFQQWNEHVKTQKPWNFEYRFCTPQGKITWVAGTDVALRNERGQITGYMGSNLNITDRKESEERSKEYLEQFHTMFDGISQLAWIAYPDGSSLLYNKRWYEYTGTTQEQMEGSGWQSVHDIEMLPKVVERWKEAISTGQPFDMEFPLRGADGRFRWFLTRGFPLKDSQGCVIRWFGTNTDISERKNLEEGLRSAVELRDEFMSIASHELKTPLTALSLQIQLLNEITSTEEGEPNAKIALLSKKAYSAIRSLIGLLNDLLDVTHIRVGKLKMVKKEMDLKDVALKAFEGFREEVKRKGISVTLNVDQPIRGMWDPNRMEQVLTNLLSNAVKYGEGKPIDVTITADYNSNLASILVKDYGIGVTKEMQTKIFERYQRAVSGETISGLGLGLYIVRQIVEAHEGTIRLESEPQKGALFIVELPMNSQKIN